MNYLQLFMYGLVLFVIVHILQIYFDVKERFENEGDQCIDEDNRIRKLTKEEKKIEKPKKNTKTTKKAKKIKPKSNKEVFLIYNTFNYLEAKDICKMYKGRLATKADLEEAHKNGANWCTWGWLEGEKIAYPVQEKYWMDIEKTHKGSCGPTAGINIIDNIDPFKKYGVTCYGVKPPKSKNDTIKDKEKEEDSVNEQISKCKKAKTEKKQKEWLEKQKNTIKILNFNINKWSELV
jgi:hypothetical protein